MLTTFNLANESVDFQSDAFFKHLVLSYDAIAKLKKADITDSQETNALRTVIKEFSKLNIALDIGYNGPAVEIPKVDKNNVLINNFVRDYVSNVKGLDLVKGADTAVRGSVNRKTGKVDGVFSEIEITLYMPLDMLAGNEFTPEEKAAITLHEVGHLLTYFEYMSNTITTNQVLSGISKGLDESGNVKEKEVLLMSAKKALKLSDLDVDKLTKCNDKKVVEMVVISSVMREASSEIGTNVYDFSSWEYLADQYAARNGCGRHLVTALDKIYRSQWNISTRNIVAYLSLEAVKLSLLFISPAIALVLLAIDGSGDGTYDRPGARMKRVRNQLIEQLKDKNLSKELIININDDIKTIDTVLEKIEDRRQLFGLLWDSLIPSARRAYKQEKLQQQLELFAGNELFKQSAELKDMFN